MAAGWPGSGELGGGARRWRSGQEIVCQWSPHLRQWPVVPAIVTMLAPATAVTLALVLARCSAATRWSHHIIAVGNCSLCCRGEVDPEQWENSVYHHKYSHQHHNAQLQQGDKGEDRVDLQPVVDFFLEFE